MSNFPPSTTAPYGQLRRANLRRDLAPIADLIEIAFANRLDADGRRYIRQMRSSAQSPNMIGFGGYVPSSLSGFVWEVEGQIVGNLNLMPIRVAGERGYLIANVATHPDYQRQGIARRLTQAAMEYLAERGNQAAWLQTDHDNPTAQKLYKDFGFKPYAKRTTWHSNSITPPPEHLPPEVRIRARQSKDWRAQKKWLLTAYPETITWHLPFDMQALQPGLGGIVNRMLSERNFYQWSCVYNSELIGVVSWQSFFGQADWLWLAVRPEFEDLAIQYLLPYAITHTPGKRTLALDYPADQHLAAFEQAGFSEHRTLVWMHYQKP